jgi:phytanoyl-CoA hydroxylase
MKAFLRRFKLSYAVYNFFHRSALQHNIPLFKKYGLKKKYYSSLSSKDFSNLPRPAEALPAPEGITASQLYREADPATREQLLAFAQNGFLVIKNFLLAAQVEAVNDEIARLQQSGTVETGVRNRIMDAIHQSALLKSIGEDSQLLELLGLLLNGEAVLFQSINFLMGSEQSTHSDSIHMTTYPLGGLLGAWIALEDITEHNGPLHYYPGSHKLPYYLNADYNNEGNAWMLGRQSYTAYEHMIAQKLNAQGIEKVIYTPCKGDLLVWHANLFHGGEPHTDKSKTRKSMVFHYFKKDVLCYHEISQRPALLKK